MANAVFPLYLTACLSGAGPDLISENVKCALFDAADYTYDPADEFLDDIAATPVALSGNLSGKTVGAVGAGVFDCDDFAFASVSGDPSEILVFFVDTGTPATSRLLSFHDGFTVTPAGTNINVTVPAGGVFSI